MESINLDYWKGQVGFGNFGDELSCVIVNCLLDFTKYSLVFNENNIQINLIAIGSYINHLTKPNSYIYGSGFLTESHISFSNLNVCSIRGPLTRKSLLYKNPHLNIPEIYGDPGLLISKFYTPIYIPELNNRIGVIPHHSNYDNYRNLNSKQYHLINPTDKWENVINSIYSCKFIISSSLHGLICSDSYNKPNIWLDEYKLMEGDFKFKDYFASQNRSYVKITKLEDFDEELLYCEGNKINLDDVINAFPFKRTIE